MAPIYITIDQERTGQNIQNCMRQRGLKVKDVQEACGFEQPQAVYKWLHGQSLPSIDNLLILAVLFQISVEGILATSGDALPSCYESACGAAKQRSKRFPVIWSNAKRCIPVFYSSVPNAATASSTVISPLLTSHPALRTWVSAASDNPISAW